MVKQTFWEKMCKFEYKLNKSGQQAANVEKKGTDLFKFANSLAS